MLDLRLPEEVHTGLQLFCKCFPVFEAGRCYLSFSIKPELALFITSLPRTQGTTVLKHPFPHRTLWVHNPCRNLENPEQALWGAARKPQHHVPQTSLFADWLQRGPAQPIGLDTVKYSPAVSRLSLASEVVQLHPDSALPQLTQCAGTTMALKTANYGTSVAKFIWIVGYLLTNYFHQKTK